MTRINNLRRRGFVGTRVLLTLALLTLGVPTLLATSGCDKKVDHIDKIVNNPSDFGDRDVTITGHVVRVLDPSSGLLNLAAYQVDDGTGKIWVVTKRGAPSVGSEVGLKARVRQDIKFSDLLGTTMLNEEERRVK